MKKLKLIFTFIVCMNPFLVFGEEKEEIFNCLAQPLEVFINGKFEDFDPEKKHHEEKEKYWLTIDGSKSNDFKPAQFKNGKNIHDENEIVGTTIGSEIICPNPSLKSNPYINAEGGETYARNVCRQKLKEIIIQCQKEKKEIIKEENKEIEAKKKDKKKEFEEKEEVLRSEFIKWTQKSENDIKITDSKNKEIEALKLTRESLYMDITAEIALGEIGIFKNPEKEEDKPENLPIEEVSQLIELLLEYKKEIEIIFPITDYSLKSEFKTLKKVKDNYQEELKTLNKELKKIEEKFSKTNLIKEFNEKISYSENRVNALTQSLLISGSSEYKVSELLNTRYNGGNNSQSTSTEGTLTLIKSYAEEKFCANIENKKNFAEKWKKTCDTNIFDKIIKLASQIVGTLGVILLIIAAIMLITARGDDTQIENGKQLILYTLGGLLIFFLSFIIVQFIIDLLVS